MNEIEIKDGYVIDMSEKKPPLCEFCAKPAGPMSQKECDYHFGYIKGVEFQTNRSQESLRNMWKEIFGQVPLT